MVFSRDGTRPIVVQSLATGTRTVLPTTAGTQNMTPAFSPDGKALMFARLVRPGRCVVRPQCAGALLRRAAERRTVCRKLLACLFSGRTPRRVRLDEGGRPADYAMSSDGSDQELLVSFDFGATGGSNAPDWSPDGASIAFHREVERSPQIFTFALAGRRLKAWTSSGRNEDPSWGPDGRHLVFISNRTGRRQLFVLDTESGQTRQIMTPGSAKLPAWSRSMEWIPVATLSLAVRSRHIVVPLALLAISAAACGKRPIPSCSRRPWNAGAAASTATPPAPPPAAPAGPNAEAVRAALVTDLGNVIHFDYDQDLVKPEDRPILARRPRSCVPIHAPHSHQRACRRPGLG